MALNPSAAEMNVIRRKWLATYDQIAAEIGAHGATAEAARRLGISVSAMRRAREWRDQGGEAALMPTVPTAPTPAKAVPSEDLQAMKAAAESSILVDDEPADVVWQREEERAARKIRKAVEGGTFRWRAPGPHLLLAFISDQHIAPGTPVDFKRMREDAELIRSTPNCYAVLGGDGVDGHIKHRAAIISARSQPEDQYKLYEYYLQILGDRCLLMISGNHDNWVKQFAGVDLVSRIARDQRICYNPDEAFMELAVGAQNYTVAVRHQYRFNSTFNQTHTVKQWLRLGEREFDIGCIGHHHEHAIESFVYRGKLRWGCRPGSYQITSAYSRQYGFNRALPTTPAFLLRGDTWDVSGYATVKQAVEAVRATREIGIS